MLAIECNKVFLLLIMKNNFQLKTPALQTPDTGFSITFYLYLLLLSLFRLDNIDYFLLCTRALIYISV